MKQSKKELRVVEYQAVKSETGFDVEYTQKYGYFHIWNNNNEIVLGVIEDDETGAIKELRIEKFRFLTDKEDREFWNEKEKQRLTSLAEMYVGSGDKIENSEVS